MRTATIVGNSKGALAGFRFSLAQATHMTAKQRKIALAQPLECPKCEKECHATDVSDDDETTYRCDSSEHARLYWRIDPDGNMLYGKVSKRKYPS